MKYSLLSSLVFSRLFSFSAVRYVTPAGAGTMNGSSWSNAYPGSSLQIAIGASASGDEVWVATGIYYTTTGTTRSISFSMKNGVSIYGSFTGTETSLSQRSLMAGVTSTLSAEIGAAGLSDNSYHTVHNTGLNTSAVLDGFVIRDANDNRTPTLTDGLGGGIYNDGAGSICNPAIRNCVITNNQAVFGGGIFNNGYLGGNSNPVILNCVITTNTATTGGGGMDNFGLGGTASPIITNCVFSYNEATQRAGAMYCWGGNNGNANPVILNSTIVNNTSADGGGFVCDRLNSSSGASGNASPDLRNCIVRGNSATGTGNAFFTLGGATFFAVYTNIDLTGQTAPHTLSGPGTGTITGNPLFVNVLNGAGADNKWLTADDGFQLQTGSPCINTGNNTGVPSTDILGNARVFNTTVDMGAYEFGSGTVAVAEHHNTFETVIVYPNPASDYISLKGTESVLNVNITDMTGRIVLQQQTEMHIDISSLEAGCYIVQVATNKQTTQLRLIKE